MTHKVTIYPHNDLFNLAHYQRGVINDKESAGVEDALSLDCLSCIISLAFTVEALLNFVGHKEVGDWKERRSYKHKMKLVCAKASLKFDIKLEPFKTLCQLKELRDLIAHGQPIEISTSISSREDMRRAMQCPWEKNLTSKYINHAYDIVKSFEKQLFLNCRINIGDTLTEAVYCGT